MRILVTGGAGFLGSHICDKYLNEGNTVVCLDNFLSGNLNNIRHMIGNRNFKLMNGDVRDKETVDEAVRDSDYVFHLAAQIHVDRSIIDPKLTYDINVLGTLNVLEAARKHDTKRVLFASTSEVYGSALQVPMTEDHPLNAPHPYGASKIAGDRMCLSYIQTYDMDIAITRLFNMYGPRQKDNGYGSVISLFANRVLNNMPPIIYGDGEQTRDYTYVTDAVAAYDLALKRAQRFDAPINFGTGQEVKINDLANMIIKLYGKESTLKPVHTHGRPGEVQRLIADATRAKALGWEPKYSLEKGLREFTDWYRDYKQQWSSL